MIRTTRQRNARIRSPSSSSSASWASASDVFEVTPNIDASSQRDELQSSPPPLRPARRRGRPPPAVGLGPVGQSVPSTVPATGGVVRRMRWTQQINENVMRAYFGATKGGTHLTAFRAQMLSVFQVLEPTINVSSQRLSDQVRFIQRRKLLDDEVLERLRTEACVVLDVVTPTTQRAADLPPSPAADIEVVDNLDNTVSPHEEQRLRRTLESAILEYKSIPASCRPRVPRLPTHRRNLALMGALDSILATYMESSRDLVDTHSILYCAAVAACRVANVKFPNNFTTTRDATTVPAWQRRIEDRINWARTLIGKLTAFQNGNNRPRVMRFVTQAFSGTNISSRDYGLWVTERIDYYKQKIYAWANRIRRCRRRWDRFQQNRTFQSDQKRVYRCWERSPQSVVDGRLPSGHDMRSYWENIWSSSVSHTEADWFGVVERACEFIPTMEAISITPEDVLIAIRPAQNWKSPGPDGLHNFWLKWFPSSHVRLAAQFQDALDGGSLPAFMTTGVTHLLYKSGSTTDPKNYRPITCLPTIYKLFTSILRAKISDHFTSNNILFSGQTGCKSGSRGTKELLLIDMTICQQARHNRRNLSAAWIDYKKAFDSVPHTWLRRVLSLYKIDTNLCTFLGSCMGQWTTVLRYPGGTVLPDCDEPIRIKRGIFQGDSLSPLWFCMALNPLSTLLLDSGLGYCLRRGFEPISHLLYMDDLKLFASKQSELIELLKITEKFSNSINMEFGVDKCAVIHVKRGKVAVSDDIQVSETVRLRSLSETETYKYLGMSESLGILSADVKQSLKERFFSRLTKVLNSFLSGGNKIRAFNGWVMPVLMYSFGILRWTQTELDALDRKVRTLLTAHRMHHPRSSVMRLYIPRRCGGRGILNAKVLHNREVCNLRDYFLHSDVGMHRAVVSVDKGLTPLSLANENWRKPLVMSVRDREEIWKSKELHGRFYRALHGPDVDRPASVSWLRFGNLFGETEGFIFAIMDEVIKTNNYRKYILKDGTVDICRACHRPGESIRHVISGCSYLANGEYLHRHNLVAKIIHQQIALRYKLVTPEVPYYQYVPQPVLENGHATLYWDRSVITDRTIVANKPDIVIIDRCARRAILVDVTVPHDDNLVKAEKDKLSKYSDLAHEVTDMWDVDSTIIVPIVVSAHGLIAKSLDQHLQRLSIGRWVKSQIQKAVLLDTARIVRRFLTLDP